MSTKHTPLNTTRFQQGTCGHCKRERSDLRLVNTRRRINSEVETTSVMVCGPCHTCIILGVERATEERA